MALGEIGLTHDYFYSLTPRVFNNITVGYFRRKDQDFKNSWEQTRQVVVSVLMPHLKKGTSTANILKFPWHEEQNDAEEVDITTINADEVLKEQQLFWDKVDKKRKQNGISTNKHTILG